MPRDARLNDPSKHLDDVGKFFDGGIRKKINYDDSFRAEAQLGEPPFNINRFGTKELTKKIVTKKLALNPRLNFIGNQPEEYEVFAGLGRFSRKENYDFLAGRPNNNMDFRLNPAFSEVWVEAYKLSPTIKPSDRVKDPMPSDANPDPRGYIMASAEQMVENETEGNVSVATLLSGKSGFEKDKKDEEEKT